MKFGDMCVVENAMGTHRFFVLKVIEKNHLYAGFLATSQIEKKIQYAKRSNERVLDGYAIFPAASYASSKNSNICSFTKETLVDTNQRIFVTKHTIREKCSRPSEEFIGAILKAFRVSPRYTEEEKEELLPFFENGNK